MPSFLTIKIAQASPPRYGMKYSTEASFFENPRSSREPPTMPRRKESMSLMKERETKWNRSLYVHIFETFLQRFAASTFIVLKLIGKGCFRCERSLHSSEFSLPSLFLQVWNRISIDSFTDITYQSLLPIWPDALWAFFLKLS